MIAIIDYGMGNLRSVQKAFEKAGAEALITQRTEDLDKAEKIVLPGVGAIQPAMERLQALGLVRAIKENTDKGKPFLGICLGFQILFEKSDEGGEVEGLGILSGSVRRFTDLKVPQMGWNQLTFKQPDCPLFKGLDSGVNVYFCHSYYVKPADDSMTAALTDYGIAYTSAVRKDNVYGTQFHPEKSQQVGLQIIENFMNLS